MMTMRIFFFAFLLTLPALLLAQAARFPRSGSIDYEKTVNAYALVKNGQYLGKNLAGSEQLFFEQYQKTQPQFILSRSTLYFRDNKTLFIPALSPAPAATTATIPMAAQNNIVYTDFQADSTVIQKEMLGEDFLLKERTRKINWKITAETREIAGYLCRRANALIMDSIYVVAFFTDQLQVAGGPESFSGLPGMILELALPHEHVIWRAVKVMDMDIPPTAVAAPHKGKPAGRQQLLNILSDAVKGRSPQAAAALLKVNLL